MTIVGGISVKVSGEIGSPKRLISVHMKRGREPDEQSIMQKIDFDGSVIKIGKRAYGVQSMALPIDMLEGRRFMSTKFASVGEVSV